jgi:hypothetical protein
MRKTPEEIQEMKNPDAQKKAEERGQAAAIQASKSRQKKEDEAKAQRQEAKDKKTALALYNRYYKDDYAKKLNLGHQAKRKKVLKLTKQLNLNFERTNQLNDLEQKDWDEVFRLAAAGDKVRKKEVDTITMVKEITQLQYIPASWTPGDKPYKDSKDDESKVEVSDDDVEETPKEKAPEPLRKAHFMGFTYNPDVKKLTKVGPLNPEWVQRFFKGVYVNIIMLEPYRWWPMVVGNSRVHDAGPSSASLVPHIPVFYQQLERDQCLIAGPASSLHYCGLSSQGMSLQLQARRFEDLPKEIASIQLREDMRRKVPCIGECVMFNTKTSKNKSIKRNLSIQDLLENRTRFPTVVIPFGRDGYNNHSSRVVDDLIFDSIQPCAMKLCRDSLDWICGNDGMGSIDVAMRFNAGHGTKEKLSHKDTKNW